MRKGASLLAAAAVLTALLVASAPSFLADDLPAAAPAAGRYAVHAQMSFLRLDEAGQVVDFRNVTFNGTSTWVQASDGGWAREDDLVFVREELRRGAVFSEEGRLHALTRLPAECGAPRSGVTSIETPVSLQREDLSYVPKVDLACLVLDPSGALARDAAGTGDEGKVRYSVLNASSVAGARRASVEFEREHPEVLPRLIQVRVDQSSPDVSRPWRTAYSAEFRLEAHGQAGAGAGAGATALSLEGASSAESPFQPAGWRWTSSGSAATDRSRGLPPFSADDATAHALSHVPSLQEFARDHPDMVVVEAAYDEPTPAGQDRTARSWSLVFGSRTSNVTLHATVSREDGLEGSRVAVDGWRREEASRQLAFSRDDLPPKLVPFDALARAAEANPVLRGALLSPNGTFHMDRTLLAVRTGSGIDGGLDPVAQVWRSLDVLSMPPVTFVVHQGRGAWNAALDAETGEWAWVARVRTAAPSGP